MEPPPPKRPRFVFHPPPQQHPTMIPPVPNMPSPISTMLPPLPPPAIDPNLVFYKTRLCQNFSTRGGVCPYGHLCRFAHGPADLREPVPNWQDIAGTQRTKLCRNFAAGACPYGDRCLYSHSHARGSGSAVRPTVPAGPVANNASRSNSSINQRCVSAHGSAVLKKTPVSVAEAVKDYSEEATRSSTLPTSASSPPTHVGTGTPPPPSSEPTHKCFARLRRIKKLNHIYADWID